jgi:SHS2 domain-containing protein
MEKGFDILDHTADIGIIAYGVDLKQTFANAATGLFSLITDLDKVVEVTYRDIELTAPDMESLLVDWLNELVYIFDVENMLFKRFDISQLDQNWLKARVYGEKVDAARHEIKLGVKAATYHMLQIVSNNGYQARVIFDI